MEGMRNPIATEDQRVTELRALELAAHPQLVQTRAEVREWWLRAVDPSPDMRACFEWAFEEVMFAAVVWSLNQDPLHPRVFAISVDSEPANRRPNHVRSSPAAHEFYIRDVMLDWERDRANEIEIVRLGAPPPRPPFTEEQQLERAAAYMWKWVKSSERWNAQ